MLHSITIKDHNFDFHCSVLSLFSFHWLVGRCQQAKWFDIFEVISIVIVLICWCWFAFSMWMCMLVPLIWITANRCIHFDCVFDIELISTIQMPLTFHHSSNSSSFLFFALSFNCFFFPFISFHFFSFLDLLWVDHSGTCLLYLVLKCTQVIWSAFNSLLFILIDLPWLQFG